MKTLPFVFVCALAAVPALSGQVPPGRGGRGPLTPEQQEQQRAREAGSGPDAPRPIDAVDAVWIEEQTWIETRDAIRGGKTTVIVGSGGDEQNGPEHA
jgi:hypothetical protein